MKACVAVFKRSCDHWALIVLDMEISVHGDPLLSVPVRWICGPH